MFPWSEWKCTTTGWNVRMYENISQVLFELPSGNASLPSKIHFEHFKLILTNCKKFDEAIKIWMRGRKVIWMQNKTVNSFKTKYTYYICFMQYNYKHLRIEKQNDLKSNEDQPDSWSSPWAIPLTTPKSICPQWF